MNRKTSGSIRSSLFNIMIRRLMERGGYFLVQPNGQNKHMVRKVRNNFLELWGEAAGTRLTALVSVSGRCRFCRRSA